MLYAMDRCDFWPQIISNSLHCNLPCKHNYVHVIPQNLHKLNKLMGSTSNVEIIAKSELCCT